MSWHLEGALLSFSCEKFHNKIACYRKYCHLGGGAPPPVDLSLFRVIIKKVMKQRLIQQARVHSVQNSLWRYATSSSVVHQF